MTTGSSQRLALAAVLALLAAPQAAYPARFLPPTTQSVSRGRSDSPPSHAIPADPARFPYNHAASIVELPSGELLTAWVAGSKEAALDTRVLLSRRPRNSTDWSRPDVILGKPDHGAANPVLFLDDRGKLWLFRVELFAPRLCTGHVAVQTSRDAGRTWIDARRALDPACTMVRNKPLITRAGRWVLPAYVESVWQSQFWLSDDRGKSWRATPGLFNPLNNNLQPALVELNDGSLFALLRCGGKDHRLWEARSTDGGEKWSLKQRPDLPNPGSGIDLTRLATGELVLAYNPSESDRTPLSVAYSDDEGKTWSPPRIIAEGPLPLAYPSIIQDRAGVVHVVYSLGVSHIQHVSFDRAWMRTKH